VLPIIAFTAKASCGNTIWKYTSIDSTNLNPLIYATDMIGCDLSTGAIKVNTNKAAGTYSVKIIGTLPGLTTTKTETFTIKIAIPN
jgi:hypothetical protein